MINILIPLAGKNQFFPEAEYPFPKPLIEFNGKTMIEHVLDNFSSIQKKKQFIFILNDEDCKKYHLDNVLNILTDHTCKIIKLSSETKGAACSAMMAVEHIDNEISLIIANADQLFNVNLQSAIESFLDSDAGVITFESIHPRWSYVRLGENNQVTETAEKRPISKYAIAGFYFFQKGQDFIASASKMIKKDASINGLYYIAPALNEMVLANKKIDTFQIQNNQYHTFYTPQKIKEYERVTTC
ncbi:MAG: nucleotidyltransferase [Erysipelotrichia bacterium]|nr:nucleotidyltransferase [Erysipelotrichia bacterium]